MPYDLAVLVVHGMGSQTASFANPMITELNERISDNDADPARILWDVGWWSPVLEKREEMLYRLLEEAGFSWNETRRFVVSALGDAVAYQSNRGKAGLDVYRAIHAHIHDSLGKMRGKLEGDVPLVVIAHSLGCAIMTNYVWDAQHGKRYDGEDFTDESTFERMKTLCGLVTFGCNLPLFSLRYDNYEPIDFPGSDISETVRQRSGWLNYYDPDDVLGYPLEPLFPPDKRVVKDKAINVGGPLSFWNPLSHSKYWTDNDFTKPVADFLTDLLKAT